MSSDKLPPVGGGEAPAQPDFEGSDERTQPLRAQLQKQRLHEAQHGREPAPATRRQLADAYFMMRQGHSLQEAARAFGIESPADIEDLREFAEKNLPRS
ncbi:hypothetical protein J2797_004275 [Paraburkholderia terricola]|uniref:hypothetical protein n=1 Tax=Paraburkholderia terricola TaxID=169427 RepID=UPI002858DF45|nr:hypothetical protein [Paraburkholderia terricola]MDR6494372.1 hypothetical protein [Paraburkholderia terricola]